MYDIDSDAPSTEECILETRDTLQALCLGLQDPPPWLTRWEAIDEVSFTLACFQQQLVRQRYRLPRVLGGRS